MFTAFDCSAATVAVEVRVSDRFNVMASVYANPSVDV